MRQRHTIVRPRMPSSRPLPRDGPTVVARAKTEAPPLAVLVRVEGAPSTPGALRLEDGCCVVGAGSDADLIIDDSSVSRRHVELSLAAEGVHVRDLGSRNGTFYMGQRIEAATLALGSVVTIGSTRVVLELDQSELDAGAGSEASYDGLLGASEPMRRLFALLRRLEGSLASVLVEGATGTGKELVARAIHRRSPLSSRPLVAVNCGAFDREMVKSDLFGHKKGAFTGAVESRDGAFEMADGGTLFLDEVGELPLDVQPILLRVLESGEVTRLGETTARHVDVRVIAATNRDLQARVDDGTFREDLYYRLAVVRLRLPPLQERIEDVPLLARHFARDAGLGELSDELLESLRGHSWPGNARELRNAVHAYAAIGALPPPMATRGGTLSGAMLGHIELDRPYADQKEDVVQAFTKAYLERLLAHTGGNQSEAARISGIERSYLGKLVTRLGLKRR